MCCLFGLIDTQGHLSGRQKSKLLSILATACEARGTDATGIAYNYKGRLVIYKRPLPAHRLRFHLPDDVQVVMGHTRMTTQGSENRNYNNHPFQGRVNGNPFALAHNGVLYNDLSLRREKKLPPTGIETDSYIAVQLLEQQKALDFSALKNMAETVRGSFAFTVLDGRDRLYFVKGDNPICQRYYEKLGLYLYASTEEILTRAVRSMHLGEEGRPVPLTDGDLLRIDRRGNKGYGRFEIPLRYGWPKYDWGDYFDHRAYVHELKSVAGAFGYAPEEIDGLLMEGFSPEEIEEVFYCGEV